ncbi:hypothetical protein F3Y22_tig00006613pilonHSYRG00064 [Hibiscus syriacus]|uniref:RNase H type-1 domain-containing protein n=1 Tax=Hibiscus syriacus TaxID=106335 RepID=A0A6A3CGY5_HIBSY|nr:hypothetical protein F3Y22_tig00006613pilonHSYRG00064 [Hibiscus syriacus]
MNHYYDLSPMEGEGTLIERCSRLVQLMLQARLEEKPSVTTNTRIHRGHSHWMLPPAPWIKLNTGVTRRETDCYARCDGIARDNAVNWLFGFSKFIGACSVIDAKLCGVYVGLNLAWDAGFRQVILELDSMEDLNILRSDYNGAHSLDWHLNESKCNWCVKIQHVMLWLKMFLLTTSTLLYSLPLRARSPNFCLKNDGNKFC